MIIYTDITSLRKTAEFCFNASAEKENITARDLAVGIVKALLAEENTDNKVIGLDLYNRYIAENEEDKIPLY